MWYGVNIKLGEFLDNLQVIGWYLCGNMYYLFSDTRQSPSPLRCRSHIIFSGKVSNFLNAAPKGSFSDQFLLLIIYM